MNRTGNRQSGFILVSVLVVAILLSMLALSLLFRMRAEEGAMAASRGGAQSWSAAMSGVYEAIRVAREVPPGQLEWRDDPTRFQRQLAYDDGVDRWYFTVYSPKSSANAGVRYGLDDEASRLNLYEVEEEELLELPGMTSPVVESLLDYVDPDSDPRPQGAEQEYYSGRGLPYAVANGEIAALDELMLVRGVSGGTIYGEDLNLNGQLDPNEDDGGERFPPDDSNGELARGLRAYVTTRAYEPNRSSRGEERDNLNQEIDLTEELPEALGGYLEAMRRQDESLAHPAELLAATGTFEDADGNPVTLESGVGREELPVLLDRYTASEDAQLKGLINVNTAPVEVLAALPAIEEALAESIVSARGGLSPEQRETPAWLFQEGLVDAETFREIAPPLTARSYQFRFQVVGYAVPSGRYRVLEAVIDVAQENPAILYLRDITRLGPPFELVNQEELSNGETG